MIELSKKEREVQEEVIKGLSIAKRKTPEPVVISLAGLVGSGKSSVAHELSKHIGGTIIFGDDIRVLLRKKRLPFDNAAFIRENVARFALSKGGTVILDADAVEPQRREEVKQFTRRLNVRHFFLRVHADRDVMIGRVIMGKYGAKDFFGGANTTWRGKPALRGAIVKLREMWRRTPHHYSWNSESGGDWILKSLPFPIFATIDTTDERKWKAEVAKVALRIINAKDTTAE